MKRTLLAVGIAVLLSLMLVRYGGTSDHRNWSEKFGLTVRHYVSYRAPFWNSQGFPVLLTELIVQTVFVAVAVAIIANFPWTKRFLLQSLVWLVAVTGIIIRLGLALSPPVEWRQS